MESIFRVWSDSFMNGQRIPEGFAYAKIDLTGKDHTAPAGNRNPQISWSVPPKGTQSLILLCEDPDAPVEKYFAPPLAGQPIPVDAPRRTFVHWVLVDIAPEESCIDAGALSKGLAPKTGPACANGMRQGLNGYTSPGSLHYGYDGPCPPWYDEKIHRYNFTVYAMDFPLLPLSGRFDYAMVKAAMAGHILASSTITGLYTLNPNLLQKA